MNFDSSAGCLFGPSPPYLWTKEAPALLKCRRRSYAGLVPVTPLTGPAGIDVQVLLLTSDGKALADLNVNPAEAAGFPRCRPSFGFQPR
jgi:hypothetical protein